MLALIIFELIRSWLRLCGQLAPTQWPFEQFILSFFVYKKWAQKKVSIFFSQKALNTHKKTHKISVKQIQLTKFIAWLTIQFTKWIWNEKQWCKHITDLFFLCLPGSIFCSIDRADYLFDFYTWCMLNSRYGPVLDQLVHPILPYRHLGQHFPNPSNRFCYKCLH